MSHVPGRPAGPPGLDAGAMEEQGKKMEANDQKHSEDANSIIRIPIDTRFKQIYASQVRSLIEQDPVKLVETNYHPDATVQSFQSTVTGHEALKEHFATYMRLVKIWEVISTDHYAETPNSIAFEATIDSSAGVLKVYDVMILRDGKIHFHFTGTR